MQDLLAGFPVVIQIPVVWGEMDAFQHVNNVVYFRYFESGRFAYFERLGFLDLMELTGIGPILASAQCRFKVPITCPDTVSVGVRVSRIEEDRCVMECTIVSHRLGRVAVEGDAVIVCYDYREKRKATWPAELKQRVMEVESSAQSGQSPAPKP